MVSQGQDSIPDFEIEDAYEKMISGVSYKLLKSSSLVFKVI